MMLGTIRVALSVLVSFAANVTALGLLLAGYWFLGSALRTEETPGPGITTHALSTPTLVVFQIVFFALTFLFVVSVVLIAIRAAAALKADRRAAIVVALFTLGLLAYPFVGLTSLMSACALGEGFPLGTECD